MITDALIAKMENRTIDFRKRVIAKLGSGLNNAYSDPFMIGFNTGCDGIEEIYQKMMQDQLRIEEVKHTMKAKSKGLTKNQKLKKLKTSKAKKLVKSKKK